MTQLSHTLLASALILLALSGLSAGQTQQQGLPWVESAKHLASNASVNDQFGWSIAVDGDTAVVGAPFADGASIGTGAAYVFVRSGSAWTEQQVLFASDGRFDDQFGFAVDIDGDTILVGAPVASFRGAAYVFQRQATGWIESTRLPAPSQDGQVLGFGISVGVSGDTAVIGASDSRHAQPSNPNCGSGSAHVFERSGDTWTETATLLPAELTCNDRFGGSVAIHDDAVVVGSIGAFPPMDVGAAHVFRRKGPNWIFEATLTPSSPQFFQNFGMAVALEDDVVLVGAPRTITPSPAGFSGRRGAAYVFHHSASGWKETVRLSPDDLMKFDSFGTYVSIGPKLAAVGAPNGDGIAPDTGTVYVYRREGQEWSEEQKLMASDGESGDAFTSVAVAADTALVGAVFDDAVGQASGSLYTYNRRTAKASFRNAGSNPASYTATAPLLGKPWQATVELATTGPAFAQVLARLDSAETLLPGGQTLLLSGPTLFRLPLQPGPSAHWSVPVPNDPALAGLSLSTQAAHFFDDHRFALSNAQDLVVGF